MNIQTTNWKPAQTTIQIDTGSGPHIGTDGLFTHEGRIWRATTITESDVTGEWVSNAEVARNQLPTLISLVPTLP
jgi:hypothetical protein